jgi:predicted RecB family nuclease
MSAKISRDVLESHLRCKTKALLVLTGVQGQPSDYENLLRALRGEARAAAVARMLALYPEGEVLRELLLTPELLKRGAPLLLGARFEDDALALRFDGLKKVPGPSRLGDFHYAPLLCHEGEKVGREQRLLLGALGLVLAGLQGVLPAAGLVFRGRGCRVARVKLTAALLDRAARALRELRGLRESGEAPRLLLNDHCAACEFRRRCHAQAVQEDNLSLLRGVSEKEVKAYARKGILTVTQLAHTFRPRRKGRRAGRGDRHRHALQALAIRDKKTYVFGTPQLPDAPTRVYLDLEGKPDEGFVYLAGVIVAEGGAETRHSFWADGPDQEQGLFGQLLELLGRYEDFRVFCYGAYEQAFLKRMGKHAPQKQLADKVLARTCNVLSLLYAHVYFPVYSDGLKEVGRHLGCAWTAPEASGLQSLVWRAGWERSGDEALKQQLVAYNQEDCTALKRVTEVLFTVLREGADQGQAAAGGQTAPPVARVQDLDRLAYPVKWGVVRFVHEDYQFVNERSYFDCQRQRVYVRTSPTLRKARPRTGRKNRRLRVSRRVLVESGACPQCGSTQVVRLPANNPLKRSRVKRAFDLAVTAAGIRRRVIECRAASYLCPACGLAFLPEKYRRLDKHWHGLKSWAVYMHVAHRVSFGVLHEMLAEQFGLHVTDAEILTFKALLARYYRPTCRRLLRALVSGGVLHADETEVKLRTGKQYVWVFASAEAVVFMLRPTREGAFLHELLKDFKGVLVSDFYAAYDSLPCRQQKCLVHLMRDINQMLLNSPFDQELHGLAGAFGRLLRAIVTTVDEHGLKKAHLRRHRGAVADFLHTVSARPLQSDAAEELRQRLLRDQGKQFTFIEHDGVAWNNTVAENAIKRFAYYREGTVGILTEAGLQDYLALLSLCHTCHYRGVSFFKFLRSRLRNLDLFCRNQRARRRPPAVEVYPRGFLPLFDRLRERKQRREAAGLPDQAPNTPR